MAENGRCRVCMVVKPQQVCLFSGDFNLAGKISEVANVEVKKGDGLPQTICTDCELDLMKSLEFRRQVIFADQRFREGQPMSKKTMIAECNIKEEPDESIFEINEEGSLGDADNDDGNLEGIEKVKVPLSSQPLDEEECLIEIEPKVDCDQPTDPLTFVKVEPDAMEVDSLQPSTSAAGPSSSEAITGSEMKTESEEENEMEYCPLPVITEMATEASLDLMPRKSRQIYEHRYEEFMNWYTGKGMKKVSESVLLAYFVEKAKVFKPSSLWSAYSMLKTTLKIKNDIDIAGFHKLIAFLKAKSVGYKPKKSKTLSQDDVSKFLLEAPDREFLMMKVILIFGIAGACRGNELVKMTTNDVKEEGSILVVTVPNSGTNKSRVFTIINDSESRPTLDYVGICKKYLQLRFEKDSNRLFLKYGKGVCMNQAVGKNTIAKIPSYVASYLGLPDPSQYTGHCFRRTSATLLVNAGGDITQLKRHDGWKSTTDRRLH